MISIRIDPYNYFSILLIHTRFIHSWHVCVFLFSLFGNDVWNNFRFIISVKSSVNRINCANFPILTNLQVLKPSFLLTCSMQIDYCFCLYRQIHYPRQNTWHEPNIFCPFQSNQWFIFIFSCDVFLFLFIFIEVDSSDRAYSINACMVHPYGIKKWFSCRKPSKTTEITRISSLQSISYTRTRKMYFR